MRLLSSGLWRLTLTPRRLLTRHAPDIGRRLGGIGLVTLLGVLGLKVVQDVHPLGAVTVQALGKVEDIEVVSKVSEKVAVKVIIHAGHGVEITLL